MQSFLVKRIMSFLQTGRLCLKIGVGIVEYPQMDLAHSIHVASLCDFYFV